METLSHDGSFMAGKVHLPNVRNFLHGLGKGVTSHGNVNVLDLLESQREGRMEMEISRLKEAVKKLEAEKEAGLSQFYKLLKKASDLESRVISSEEESRVLKEQASEYETDKICSLRKMLLEAEDRARRVGVRVHEAENEIERLKKEVVKLEEERGVEASSVLEKLGSLEKLIDEKLSFEIEKRILVEFLEGVAYDADQLFSKNVVLEKEKESLRSQVKDLHELIECLKLKFGETLDQNVGLVLEKSVLFWLFEEMKIEAADAEKERKAFQENLKNKSRKVMELKTEVENLNEILKQREDERNEHEERLKLQLDDLNAEFSGVQESYQNLQTQMAKVVQENMVLRKDFSDLKRQNIALFEDFLHQNELQPHEAEQNHVAMLNEKMHWENSVEIPSYSKELLCLDEQKYSKAVDVQTSKEIAKLETVDYMTRFSISDMPNTLAEELRYKTSHTLDDQRVCTDKHMTPHKSHIDLRMSAPLWGLNIGKSRPKASSVYSDAHYEKVDDQRRELCDTESASEKKHKSRMSDLGKKLHLKNYLPRSRSVTHDHEGQRKSKKKGFWSRVQSPTRGDSTEVEKQ